MKIKSRGLLLIAIIFLIWLGSGIALAATLSVASKPLPAKVVVVPLDGAPIVVTGNATDITTTTTILNGILMEKGTSTNVLVSFQWGLTDKYTSETTKVSGNNTGPFSFKLTGLSANTTYHYRAIAYGDGANCGTDGIFKSAIHDEANVNINVTLQGGSRPDSGWVVPLTVKFFISGNTTPVDVLTATPISTFNLTTARSGNTTASSQVTGVIPGTYDITVTSPHCLTNVKRGVVIAAPSSTINMGTLLEGNANDDNKINIQDFGVLAASYGKSSVDTGFDTRADFDRNNKINITDFGLLAANYGKYAPIEIP